jgi:hypothetical protein
VAWRPAPPPPLGGAPADERRAEVIMVGEPGNESTTARMRSTETLPAKGRGRIALS